jgi:hypothetical protein
VSRDPAGALRLVVVVAAREFHKCARLAADGPRVVARWKQHHVALILESKPLEPEFELLPEEPVEPTAVA